MTALVLILVLLSPYALGLGLGWAAVRLAILCHLFPYLCAVILKKSANTGA